MRGPRARLLILRREGQTLPIMVVFLVVLLSLGALAMDLGMIVAARTEAQRAADAIALAAASAFIGSPSSASAEAAKARAKENAAKSLVLSVALDTATVAESRDAWQSPEVRVEILRDSMKVRALVRRRGVGVWIDRIFGEDATSVAGMAAAEAAVPGASTCMVPFAIPVDPNADLELGQIMVLRTADSSTVAGPDPVFAPFALEEGPDARPSCPRENPCGLGCMLASPGDEKTLVTLDMDSPTTKGLHARLARDPDVFWNDRDDRLWRGGSRLQDYVSTPRVVRVPTFDRSELTESGQGTFTITGIAYFFLESAPEPVYAGPAGQLEITGRFLFHDVPEDPESATSYARALRLAR